MKDFETPKMAQTLPHYLNYEEAVKLLESISGDYKERDYAIITLFLNCGLRVSELVKLNLTDIHADGSIRILGKGNKERIVYLTPACVDALSVYIPLRSEHPKDPNALFLSRLRKRISIKTVQWLVKKFIERAGLDEQSLSVHKLRHTAATLMYQNGADLRVLQEILGHANLGTTQIYTHVANTQLREAALLNPLANKK